MNLREGTRRLALLFGAAGTILCAVLSYAQLQSLMRQRADHMRFEQLANSPAVEQERKDWFLVNLPAGAIPDPSKLNKGGVGTIHWNRNLEIASIETQDGQTLYPTPAPGAWSYALIAILPLLGFFIPWGAVRAIGWVLAGFVQPSK